MRFQKGHGPIGGRRKGSRDKIATALLEAIAEDFAEHGAEVIKLARVERPTEYLKVVASLLPKEFEITDSRLKDIPDDELDALIEVARRRLAAGVSRGPDGREEPAIN
jgi:hypothetical protein